MPPLSKRRKQIKNLAEKKRKKISEPLENSDFEDNESDDEEIVWGDDEFDKKAETFVKILSDGMKNYIPSARRSVYIGNSVRTKKRKKAQAKQLLIKNGQPITRFFSPLPQTSDKSDDDQESECDESFDYKQLIISVENELKQSNHDGGYKLRLTALLQYFRLVDHQEPKVKASLCVA